MLENGYLTRLRQRLNLGFQGLYARAEVGGSGRGVLQARLLLLGEARVGTHGVVEAGVGTFLFAFVFAPHDAFQRLAELSDLLP